MPGAVYVLVPMPFLLLNGDSLEGSDRRETRKSRKKLPSRNSPLHSTWADVAKFLTGVGAVATIGVPVVLAHGGILVSGQLALALPSAVLLGGTAVAYDFFNRREDGGLYESLLY